MEPGKSRIFDTILKRLELRFPLRYAISDKASFPDLSHPEYLRLLFETSAHLIQLREKDLTIPQLRPLVQLGVKLASESGKIFLVNGNFALALEEGGDGVHLTSSQPVAEAVLRRREAGRAEFLVGRSVHSADAARQAAEEGADYLLLSPVLRPFSKKDRRAPLGIRMLQSVVREVPVPVFSLGGMTMERLALMGSIGAAGIAGISWASREARRRLQSPAQE